MSERIVVPGRVTHIDVEFGVTNPTPKSIKEWFDHYEVPDFQRAAMLAHHEAGPSPWFPLGHERDLSKQITEDDFKAALTATLALTFA